MARYVDADKINYRYGVDVGSNLGGLRAIALKSDIDNMPPADVVERERWTPCSKGLPDPQDNGDKDFSDWVQITINIGHPEPKDPYVTEGYYCFSEQKWYTKRFVVGVVTAWMPLPEPYKES